MRALMLLLASPLASGFAPASVAVRRSSLGGHRHLSLTMADALFPNPEAIGAGGRLCAVVFYARDGVSKVEALLRAFQNTADDYAELECSLVAVRSVESVEGFKPMDKSADYAQWFPSFEFVNGLEGLADAQAAISSDLPKLVQNPRVVLLDPDSKVLALASDTRVNGLHGDITRALKAATSSEAPADGRSPGDKFEEDQRRRQEAYGEHKDWAEILCDNPELRQPTRYWFDGLYDGPAKEGDLLEAAAQQNLLSGAEQRKLSGSGGEGGEVERIELPELKSTTKDGREVKAPDWYVYAKAKAEIKQAREKEEWDGHAPAGTAGPFPLGPEGRELEPMKKALGASGIGGQKLLEGLQTFANVMRDFDNLAASLPGDAPAAGAPAAPGGAPARPAPREPSKSTLARAQLLSLGLSRSGTSSGSTRRLRLLRELEASVDELEQEGLRDQTVLGPLKRQVAESWASAPADARRQRKSGGGVFSSRLSVDEIKSQVREEISDFLDMVLKNQPKKK